MSDDTNTTRENPRKVREGIVVSDKMNSTVVVAVMERVAHPRYGKTVQRTKKLYAVSYTHLTLPTKRIV